MGSYLLLMDETFLRILGNNLEDKNRNLNVNTVIPQYLRGTGSRNSRDTKTNGWICLSAERTSHFICKRHTYFKTQLICHCFPNFSWQQQFVVTFSGFPKHNIPLPLNVLLYSICITPDQELITFLIMHSSPGWSCTDHPRVFSQIVLCGGQGCCPVHFRMFSRIPGLYSPDSSNTLSTLDNRNCLQTLWNFSWERRRGEGKIALGWETSCPWHEGETVLFLRRKGLKYWVGQKVHLVFHKVLWKNLNEFLANPVLRAEFHFSSLSLNGLTRQMYGTEKVWQILTG